jgi:hypothetical protein
MLRDTQDVAIGISEPRYFRARGRCPNALCVLFQLRVTFELDSGLFQILHRGARVRNLPAQNGTVSRRKLLGQPQTQHDAICIEDQGERRLFADEAQT